MMTIEEEYKKWCVDPYAGKTKEERKKLGQFFTPPVLTKQMIETLTSLLPSTL